MESSLLKKDDAPAAGTEPPGESTSWGQVLAVLAAALLLFLAIGEAATRVANRDSRSYDLEMFKYSRELKRDAPPEAREMHHWHIPGSFAVLQNAPVTINSKGLRDAEYDYPRKAGVKRILALGDSITFGWGVKVEDTYAKVLERALNAGAASPKYEVLNCGVGNYTASRILGLYEHELHKYRPDVVSLAFFINNANETPDTAWKTVFNTPLQFPIYLWSRLQRVTARYSVTKGFDRYYQDLYRDDNPVFAPLRAKLVAFIKKLRGEGKKVVVLSIPDCMHLDEKPYRYQYVTDKVFALAREAGAETLDLLPSVQGMKPQEIMNTPEDRHPNAEGHRRMGMALHEKLKGMNL